MTYVPSFDRFPSLSDLDTNMTNGVLVDLFVGGQIEVFVDDFGNLVYKHDIVEWDDVLPDHYTPEGLPDCLLSFVFVSGYEDNEDNGYPDFSEEIESLYKLTDPGISDRVYG